MSDGDVFNLPAETLEQATDKAHAILEYWRATPGKEHRDVVDVCYAVACWRGGSQWGQSPNWRTLLAAVRGEPLPL